MMETQDRQARTSSSSEGREKGFAVVAWICVLVSMGAWLMSYSTSDIAEAKTRCIIGLVAACVGLLAAVVALVLAFRRGRRMGGLVLAGGLCLAGCILWCFVLQEIRGVIFDASAFFKLKFVSNGLSQHWNHTESKGKPEWPDSWEDLVRKRYLLKVPLSPSTQEPLGYMKPVWNESVKQRYPRNDYDGRFGTLVFRYVWVVAWDETPHGRSSFITSIVPFDRKAASNREGYNARQGRYSSRYLASSLYGNVRDVNCHVLLCDDGDSYWRIPSAMRISPKQLRKYIDAQRRVMSELSQAQSRPNSE